MSDRALQDDVIRYLTDAGARAGGPTRMPILPAEAARAGRFANFLARHYYRDRLARSFQYSYAFREETGRSAEQAADSPEFDSFLGSCVLGSLDSAQRVGEIARNHMLAVEHPAPWWNDLIDYEYAYFLQAATSELTPLSIFPAQGRSALIRQFDWAMPELLSRVRGAPSSASVIRSDDLHRQVTLLFSRNSEGRLFVVEVEDTVAAVLNVLNGSRDVGEIATLAGVTVEEVKQVISALANIGAVVPSSN